MTYRSRVIDDITRFIFVGDDAEPADIIFIPGCSYPGLAERAAGLYAEGYAPWVLPSGKYGVALGAFAGVKENPERYPGEYLTEHAFLRHVLVRNGVPEERILTEDLSRFTHENAAMSRQVCDAAGLSVGRALLCCKSFHARRALIYYSCAFPETDFRVIPVDVDGLTKDNWHTSAKGFDRVMGEVWRSGDQVAETLWGALRGF